MFSLYTFIVFYEIYKTENTYKFYCRQLIFMNRNNPDYILVREKEPFIRDKNTGLEESLKFWNIAYYFFVFFYLLSNLY
jgi:hypothetical protein